MAGKSGSQAVNGELDVIRKIEGCKFDIETESGRQVTVDVLKFRHLDHGYAVTSHSSQGQTVDRVIINADTRETPMLLNRRMAYIALTRAREDGLIFTNSATELSAALDRRRDKEMAIESWSKQSSYASASANREHTGSETMRPHHHQEPQRLAEPGFNLGI
jgi:ATP-dependent exoDNAse (exonuclease V) alpha subunit